MSKKITVIGAGGTGCCAAANFVLHGHEVTLCEEEGVCENNLRDIRERGGFELTGRAENGFVHLGGSLLNTGAVENSENFCFYDTGLTPSVIRMIETLGAERDAISAALGYTVRSSVGFMKQLADKQAFPQFDSFRGLEGPLTMQDRYIFEDAQNGASFLSSLGDLIGCPAPVARALVTVASAISGTDYYASGRTVDKLGLQGRTAEEINRFLFEGTL